MTHRSLALALPLLVLVAGLGGGGCNKESAAPAKIDKDDKSSDSKKDKKEPPKASWKDEAGRAAKCEFVEWKGKGDDRKAMFKITPTSTKKKIDSVQTWEFYYDKAGKFLTRYPHSTSIEEGAQALGSKGDSIDKDTDVVECEVTRINYEDGTAWFNANLQPEGDRPKGGVTKEYLKEHAGEKVEVEVVDAKKGKLKLHNISDKEVTKARLEIVFEKGKDKGHESRRGVADLPIKPGKTVEYTLKYDKPAPDEYKSAEAAAADVEFDDDTSFTNKNLDSYDR